ncbi:hypothetical protein OZX67_02065 [Bifidobacterium sp. ESL0728]|uniref:hypothetical protein n=1 Tax=Bifidobacterium sp. ESL0728 TaxID=2983220 RepID=UPI0023F7B3D7|nr:hypothetical protein [Bifidobacterium sp. ESL0728]WEV59371.1 hypothetical protein OZX67_02065 [Bifidobacterium sp. ESL0728]
MSPATGKNDTDAKSAVPFRGNIRAPEKQDDKTINTSVTINRLITISKENQ